MASRADDQVGDEPGPAGLVGGPEAGAGVAVEVLVEEDQVVPRWVLLQLAVAAEDGAPALLVPQEQRDQAARELVRDLGEVEKPAGAGRALDAEPRAEEAVVDAQHLDEQEVDRVLDRPAPVRV